MSTIVTIASGDLISNSRADINTNFSNLNTDKFETSNVDTDTTLAANSDTKVASQKATKAYVDAGGNVNASTTAKGIVEEATAAEVAAGTATGGTGARLFMNPSTAGTKFSTTTVYASAAAPTSFTDLDLSSVIGVAQRMVVLKLVVTGGVTACSVWFRRNGDTHDYTLFNPGNGGGGTNMVRLDDNTGAAAQILTATDASGVVEWMASSGTPTMTVQVEAYW